MKGWSRRVKTNQHKSCTHINIGCRATRLLAAQEGAAASGTLRKANCMLVKANSHVMLPR